eukprot:TRINITY_DN25101_c0_g1_i2.p1 TRINITY_DN25101_c0_g1~~TRINITY_DN25101_c0_g1_i2.p1  ORF type:complete len:308 (+),score=42.28 TRINITY_DN25101_c0_g1_i2:156-1079(+)
MCIRDSYNWNRVIFMYCDGAFHQGMREEPIEYKASVFKKVKLYIRGYNNTMTILNDIPNLKQATQIVVSGGSAGGVAAFIWADYIQEWLGTSVNYAAIPDSGYVYDVLNVQTNTHLTRIQLESLYNISNAEIRIPQGKCADFYDDQGWRCLITSDLVSFIETNLFIIHSEYDAWFIPNSLGIDCINNLTLKSCSNSQMNDINNYRSEIINKLAETISIRPNWGVWSPACVYHVLTSEQTFNSSIYEIPMQSGNTLAESIDAWIKSEFKKNNESQSLLYSRKLLEEEDNNSNAYIDTAQWPNNAPCAF